MNLEKIYTIFKDEYGKYKIGLSHKTMDGKVEFANFPVRFKKGVELENKTKIYIKNYWLDFYNWEYQGKKGTSYYIFINEFTTLDEAIEPSKKIVEEHNDPFKEFSETHQEELDDLSLPF